MYGVETQLDPVLHEQNWMLRAPFRVVNVFGGQLTHVTIPVALPYVFLGQFTHSPIPQSLLCFEISHGVQLTPALAPSYPCRHEQSRPSRWGGARWRSAHALQTRSCSGRRGAAGGSSSRMNGPDRGQPPALRSRPIPLISRRVAQALIRL